MCGMPYASPHLPPGTKLQGGKYTVGKVLGQGGFGITYQGADVPHNRPVAIKEFFPDGSSRRTNLLVPPTLLSGGGLQDALQSFLDEARTLTRFNHPGIVDVFDVFEENHTAYLVMETLARGNPGQARCRAGALGAREVMELASRLTDALDVVHEAGLLHRDIKPDNIFLTQDGRTVLIDFGSARAYVSGQTVSHTRLVTPGYAPLEQYTTEAQFGPYTDIYALAATLYHAATGTQPPPVTDRLAGVELGALPAELPPGLRTAIEQGLEIRVDARPATVAEFRSLLTQRVRPRREEDPTPAPQVPETRTSERYDVVLRHSGFLTFLVVGELANLTGSSRAKRCGWPARRGDTRKRERGGRAQDQAPVGGDGRSRRPSARRKRQSCAAQAGTYAFAQIPTAPNVRRRSRLCHRLPHAPAALFYVEFGRLRFLLLMVLKSRINPCFSNALIHDGGKPCRKFVPFVAPAIPEDAQFCEGCGVELTSATTTPVQEDAQEETPEAAPVTGDAPAPPESTEPTPDAPAESATESPASDDGAAADASSQESPPENAEEAAPASPTPETEAPEAETPETETPEAETPTAPAKLFAKRHGTVSGDPIPLSGGRLVVGRFDPSSGPVDIDVTELGGAEHISRRHGELFAESGVWKVRDLGSTNGVFLKRAGEEGYGPRLQEPAELGDGDEVAFGNVIFVFRQDAP